MDKGWGQESMGQGSRNKHASVTACDNFIVSGIKSVVQQMKIIIIWGKKKNLHKEHGFTIVFKLTFQDSVSGF